MTISVRKEPCSIKFKHFHLSGILSTGGVLHMSASLEQVLSSSTPNLPSYAFLDCAIPLDIDNSLCKLQNLKVQQAKKALYISI